MHQMNVILCVCGGGGVEGDHVYLPSPLFLLLPDRPFVLTDRVCSVYFGAPLWAALGLGCIQWPSSTPAPTPTPVSSFSSVSCCPSNSVVCLVFAGESVESVGVRPGPLTPSQGVSARFTSPDLREQT